MNVADFRTLVLSFAGVSDIVDDRMFPIVIPQEVYDSASEKPCIVYTVTNVSRSQTFCATEELEQTSVDVDCYDPDYDACQDLANEVRSSVTDFRGVVGSTTFGPIYVSTETDIFDPEPGLYRRVLTLNVWSANT